MPLWSSLRWRRAAGDAGHDAQTLAELTEKLRERDAELDRLRTELDTQARASMVHQQELNKQMRRRAREAIDDTAEVIGAKLEDVVLQVGAARDAAAATNERVSISSDAANALILRAHSADEAATALNASLRQVAGIASVISGIASQTRLLALNATIEAVRAGTAGSGFAVVADEVKGLADTTADSTEQITSTIAALEKDVAQMGQTMSAIISDVGDIGEAMRQLNGIADQQHEIVGLLHRSVDATMEQIGDLSGVADRLERRRHDRLPVQGFVRLERPGRPSLQADLLDLSSDGLGCTVPASVPLAVGDPVRAELTMEGLDGTFDAKVVRRVVRGSTAELGIQFGDLTDQTRARIGAVISRIVAGL
ncbi:MAG TPA: methyl-accepting chemotaxis protein [Actinoplanes sp.]|nr:methyl-accepting chemotaxis protein [Actinoplanes sp.]